MEAVLLIEGTPLICGALVELLRSLQPRDTAHRSLSSQNLLHTLQSALGDHVLPLGEEHDAAEGLELLMQALSAELTTAFHAHAEKRLQAKAALRSVLKPAQSPAQLDPLLVSWHAMRLPCEGLLAHHMQCVRCRYHFDTQYAPFMTLSMPLPVTAGVSNIGVARVAPNSSLVPCFDAIFGYELVTGVECPGCSVRASLMKSNIPPPKPPTPPTSPRSLATGGVEGIGGDLTIMPSAAEDGAKGAKISSPRSSSKAFLTDLWRCVDEMRPLPSERSIESAFKAADVPYLRQKSQVTRRGIVARWPPLLILHLRRTFWTPEGQQVKVVGHVRFPLRLALEAKDAQKVAYRLVAVIEHSGLSAGTGHYVTYRSIGVDVEKAKNPKHAKHMPQKWVRVSDEDVKPVEESEVIAADAAMLYYQESELVVVPASMAAAHAEKEP